MTKFDKTFNSGPFYLTKLVHWFIRAYGKLLCYF